MGFTGCRTLPFFVHKYECREHIGGNMSEVYLAYDARAERSVVVKLMRPEQRSDQDLRERFLQEGRLACRCSHPNVITTYVTDEDDCGPYIVMERLPGQSLRDLITSGSLSAPLTALKIAAQVAEALLYLHNIDILHRDIKPTNIFVSNTGHAKIFDFGIARGGDFALTRAGDVIGTPNYMAPEQILGKPVDQRTDIYSFGVLLYEMLALTLPYRGSSIEEITAVILHAPPDVLVLQNRNVPPPILALVLACLQKKPENRPQSFETICQTLSDFLSMSASQILPRAQAAPSPAAEVLLNTDAAASNDPRPNRTLPIALVAIVLVAAIAAGLFFYMRPSHGNAGAVTSTQSASSPAAATPHPAPSLQGNSGEMVLVEAGPVSLGDAGKPRKVSINSFYIDKEEVSQDLYLRFCHQTGHAVPTDLTAGNLPVVRVSFFDATAFAKWAGARLPTADEWEKAARGPHGSKYPWGDEFKADLANVRETKGQPKPLQPVDSLPEGASAYGALNMLGNVWEWVATPAEPPAGADFAQYLQIFKNLTPPLSRTEAYYQIRGGSFTQMATHDELARFLWDETPFPARARQKDVGFRCARDVQ